MKDDITSADLDKFYEDFAKCPTEVFGIAGKLIVRLTTLEHRQREIDRAVVGVRVILRMP